METFTKDNSKMENVTELDTCTQPMGISLLDNGKKINEMVGERSIIRVEILLKDSIVTIKNMDLAQFY